MNWSNDTCPITNEPAKEALPRDGDNIEFACPTCGRFRVSGTAYEVIRNFPEDIRKTALEHARTRAAPDGSMPKIMYDDLSTI